MAWSYLFIAGLLEIANLLRNHPIGLLEVLFQVDHEGRAACADLGGIARAPLALAMDVAVCIVEVCLSKPS